MLIILLVEEISESLVGLQRFYALFQWIHGTYTWPVHAEEKRKKNVIYSLFQQEFGGLTAAARHSINTTEERISRIYLVGHSPSELHANEVAGKQLWKSFNTSRGLDRVLATQLWEWKVLTDVRGRWVCCKSLITIMCFCSRSQTNTGIHIKLTRWPVDGIFGRNAEKRQKENVQIKDVEMLILLPLCTASLLLCFPLHFQQVQTPSSQKMESRLNSAVLQRRHSLSLLPVSWVCAFPFNRKHLLNAADQVLEKRVWPVPAVPLAFWRGVGCKERNLWWGREIFFIL